MISQVNAAVHDKDAAGCRRPYTVHLAAELHVTAQYFLKRVDAVAVIASVTVHALSCHAHKLIAVPALHCAALESHFLIDEYSGRGFDVHYSVSASVLAGAGAVQTDRCVQAVAHAADTNHAVLSQAGWHYLHVEPVYEVAVQLNPAGFEDG